MMVTMMMMLSTYWLTPGYQLPDPKPCCKLYLYPLLPTPAPAMAGWKGSGLLTLGSSPWHPSCSPVGTRSQSSHHSAPGTACCALLCRYLDTLDPILQNRVNSGLSSEPTSLAPKWYVTEYNFSTFLFLGKMRCSLAVHMVCPQEVAHRPPYQLSAKPPSSDMCLEPNATALTTWDAPGHVSSEVCVLQMWKEREQALCRTFRSRRNTYQHIKQSVGWVLTAPVCTCTVRYPCSRLAHSPLHNHRNHTDFGLRGTENSKIYLLI